jgi:tetratricopeptide (TPR) repeat protein
MIPKGFMMMHYRIHMACWLTISLLSPSAGADSMIKYATPAVRLYTDLERDQANRVVDEITFFADFIDRFFRSYGITSRKENPIRCRLFSSTEEFHEYCRKRNLRYRVGAYFSASDNCIIAPFSGGMSTLRHECAHQIMARYFNHRPPWIDEGLACYFQGVAFDVHHNPITDCSKTSRLKEMRALLKREGLMEWNRFFGYEDRGIWDDEIFRGVLNMGDYYSQSWGVVYYYLHSESSETRELFARFMKGMHTGRSRTKMILQDLPRKGAAFRTFFREDHEMRLKLYQTALAQREAEQCGKALETLITFLAHAPDNSAGQRLAAEVAWDGALYEESLAFWRKLAEKEPRESLYQWKICRCLVEMGDEALLDEALKVGKKAVKMTKSKDPYCFAALARAHYASGQVREALGAVRNALRFKCDAREEHKSLEKKYSDALRNR